MSVCLALPLVLAIVACGGTPPTGSTPSATTSTQAAAGLPSCNVVNSGDFAKVGGPTPARVLHLANAIGRHRTCSDLFIDASGGLILSVTEEPARPGGLAAARAVAQGQTRGAHVRRIPGIRNSFVAGPQLAFLSRGRLFAIGTGYTSSGERELTSLQLVRLARLVASR
jgi:hypothetical protein